MNEGIVGSDLQTVRIQVVQSMTHRSLRSRARDLSQAEIDAILELLLSDGLEQLVRIHMEQSTAFLEAVLEIYKEAVALGTPKEEYKAKIRKMAQRFGSGDVAQTWLDSGVVRPFYHKGQRQVHKHREVLKVAPYLRYNDQEDDRVRPNHHLLHGFTARSDWDGWDREVLPPQGWGCRCFVEEVYWTDVPENLPTFMPGSEAKLLAFREAGGHDAGFPRELFVAGALAA